MTKHDLSYDEFVLTAQCNGIFTLLQETTADIPEGMRHTYAPIGEKIAGCFGESTGTWFRNPLKFEKRGRKFRKIYI